MTSLLYPLLQFINMIETYFLYNHSRLTGFITGARAKRREVVVDKSELRSRVVEFREKRMWMQGRLTEKAGGSPTSVSGIESGRISRPHFGTVKKLARASGADTGVALR
jgi:ribosome-binding protein aMBF1 (putative translation factor)